VFTSAIKREIRTFHVVVVQRRKRNVLKKCAAARAKLLFCQIYTFLPFLLPSPSSLLKLPNTKLQTDRSLLRPRLYRAILYRVEVSLVCPNLANRLHEKQKVGCARRVACHRFFNGRATLLAGLTWLDINTLACPVRSTNNNNNNNSFISSRQYS